MKKLIQPLLILLMLLGGMALAEAEVRINEIMTDNGVFVDGENDDWVELYNVGPEAVDVSGWGLSDKENKPRMWQLPQGAVLKPGEYLLVYCVGEDVRQDKPRQKIYFAPFKLSAEGETLILTDTDGHLKDRLAYPAQYGNISYGRAGNMGTWGYFEEATPRKGNGPIVYSSQAPRPVIDQAPGFYALADGEQLTVTLSGSGPIYYTLDGSTPTRQAARYTAPLFLTETTVVRARICPEDQLMSSVASSTYLINDPSPVAVVSLSTDDEYLYSKEKGLLVRGEGETPNYMTDWEYPMHFEFFDENGVCQLSQQGSFHIVGTSSRGYKQKSLAVYARSAYGDGDLFHYNPFANRDYEAYHTLVMRSTSSDFKGARVRDAALTSLAKGLGLMYLDARPIVVYINGQYAGQYNLREKVNKHSIAQWEGVTSKALIDRIDILQGEAKDHQVQNGDNADWLALRAFVKANDLRKPENLKYVTDRLDVESLFTWAAFEMCTLNKDLENVRMYRVPGGKWKYVLYDVDDGAVQNKEALYMLLDSRKASDASSSQYSLLNKLLQVPQMRDQFLKRLAFVIENSFLYETVVGPVFEGWKAVLEQTVPRHLETFGEMTVFDWRQNYRAAQRSIRIAPKTALKYVIDKFALTSEEEEYYFGPVQRLLDVQNAKEMTN